MAGMAETRNPDPNTTCLTSKFYDSLTDQTITLNQVTDWKPVLWGPTYSEVHQLPVWPGDTVGLASAINDQGQVVGGSGFCTTPATGPLEHALLWQNENAPPINLGSLGGTYDNLATAINDRGQVVGWSDLPHDSFDPQTGNFTGTTHSFLWQDGIMTDLGTLPGDGCPAMCSAYAYGINNAGQVVGESCDENNTCDAFLSQNGTMTDLNNPAIERLTTPGSFAILQAEGINSQGEIVGAAIDTNPGSPFFGDLLAFSAVPCGTSPATDRSCSQSAHGTITTAGPSILTPGTDLAPDRSRMRPGSFAGLP